MNPARDKAEQRPTPVLRTGAHRPDHDLRKCALECASQTAPAGVQPQEVIRFAKMYLAFLKEGTW